MPEYWYICSECGLTASRRFPMGKAPATIEVESDIHSPEVEQHEHNMMRRYTPFNLRVVKRRAEEE